MSPHFCKVLAGMEIVMKKLIFNNHVKYFLLFSLNTDTLKICTLTITVHGSFLAKKNKIFTRILWFPRTFTVRSLSSLRRGWWIRSLKEFFKRNSVLWSFFTSPGWKVIFLSLCFHCFVLHFSADKPINGYIQMCWGRRKVERETIPYFHTFALCNYWPIWRISWMAFVRDPSKMRKPLMFHSSMHILHTLCWN